MSPLLEKALILLGSAIVALAFSNIILWSLNIGKVELYDHDPDYGYLTKPDQWPSPRGIVFRINSAGLRGSDFRQFKASDVVRITFVGDSVTFAGGIVSDSDTFIGQAAARLRQITGRSIDTVNISAPGWGVQNMAAYIKRHGFYGADLVVWVLPREDFYRPFGRGEGMPTSQPAFRLGFLLTVSIQRAYVAAKQAVVALLPKPQNASGSKPVEVLRKNILAFQDAVREAQQGRAQLILVFFPEGSRSAGSLPQAFRQYSEAARSLGAGVCDASPQIESAGGATLFYDGAHLNPRGHRVASLAISDCLLKTAAVFRERNNLTRLRDATALKLRSTPGRHTNL